MPHLYSVQPKCGFVRPNFGLQSLGERKQSDMTRNQKPVNVSEMPKDADGKSEPAQIPG